MATVREDEELMKIHLANLVYPRSKPAADAAPDTESLRTAARHLNADWRNSVWIDGRLVHAVGRVDGEFDDRLVVDGVVTPHRTLAKLVRSREWTG